MYVCMYVCLYLSLYISIYLSLSLSIYIYIYIYINHKHTHIYDMSCSTFDINIWLENYHLHRVSLNTTCLTISVSGTCMVDTDTPDAFKQQTPAMFGWHYLSNATCLMRPRLLYALCIVSRINILCYILRQC